MNNEKIFTLGIDIGSTTVKIAILDSESKIIYSNYQRHFANIKETLFSLLNESYEKFGNLIIAPVITGSGGLTLAKHLDIKFVQEVISVSSALEKLAPKTDVAIELGGEDAKIIYFQGNNVEQRMNGSCAGGTGAFPGGQSRYRPCRRPCRGDTPRFPWPGRWPRHRTGIRPSAPPAAPRPCSGTGRNWAWRSSPAVRPDSGPSGPRGRTPG